MPARKPPARHWRSYGDEPLPTSAVALGEPFAAFPSWYLRVICDRCNKVRIVNEVHTEQRDMPLREIIWRMRHDGCGGGAGRAELLTGLEGVTRGAVRCIVLVEG
jgi:hypothetical protein